MFSAEQIRVAKALHLPIDDTEYVSVDKDVYKVLKEVKSWEYRGDYA